MEVGVYHEFHCRPDQTPAAAFAEALAQVEARQITPVADRRRRV